MVEAMALRLAEAIKRIEPDRTASIAVMKFSIEVLMNTLITLFFISIVGFLTGAFGKTMLGLGAFVLLRFFSGGLHLSKAIHCSFLSVILISIAPHIPLSNTGILIIGGANLILILAFAPSNIEGHARIPNKYFPLLKLVSALIVSINFVFLSSTIVMVQLFQAISTINFKRR